MKKKILVIRFSAMGDVALTSPVIASVLEQHPDLEIVFLSRPLFKSFFQTHERFTFIGADLKGKHKGLFGLNKLKKELLKDHQFDAVLDLHDVLRSKILRFFFKQKQLSTFAIDKGRKEKKALLKGDIPFKKLKHTTQRYLDVFAKAGFYTQLNNGPWLTHSYSEPTALFLEQNQLKIKQNSWIGIAPFAAHSSKEWSLSKMKKVISTLLESGDSIFLFGGGQREIELLNQIQLEFPKCILVAGKLKLEDEIILISKLDVMVAMDSSNMHLAALLGTKVVSIWGATHHFLGFGPLHNEKNIVEISKEELPCRPCSIYGKLKTEKNKMCAETAMEMISVETVIQKINSVKNAV